MRVLMINSVCDYGSTGTICTDIATVLEEQGHECFIAYGQGTTNYPKAYKIGTVLENHLHNVQSRVFGKQGYYTKNGTRKLIEFIKSIGPDIVHLHNIHGNYLNLDILFDFLSSSNSKVIWTLHDCWAFTGKCAHYTDVGCYKWKVHCNNCPQIHSYPPSLFFDRSRVMYEDKRKWFTSVKDMTLITVSQWLDTQVQHSFLSNLERFMIYNWVDMDVFKPGHKSPLLKKLGINEHKFTVLLVSAFWDKNTEKWKDMVSLSHMLGENYQILVVGKNKHKHLMPPNALAIDYVNGRTKLAELYSFANVYVHLSTEDTFGKVIAEAMSCGTPAVVYNSTACPEVVGNVDCGTIVAPRSITEMYQAIIELQGKAKDYYLIPCRERVRDNFSMNMNIQHIISIYKRRLGNVD